MGERCDRFVYTTLGTSTYVRYLVQQYDKEYKLWSKDLKTQMEMTAWVLIQWASPND